MCLHPSPASLPARILHLHPSLTSLSARIPRPHPSLPASFACIHPCPHPSPASIPARIPHLHPSMPASLTLIPPCPHPLACIPPCPHPSPTSLPARIPRLHPSLPTVLSWQRAGTCGQRRGSSKRGHAGSVRCLVRGRGTRTWGQAQIEGPILASPQPWVPGGLREGWWMPGAWRLFMVSEGSINSLNIQPFQVGFVEN